jgi:hypothetical protein
VECGAEGGAGEARMKLSALSVLAFLAVLPSIPTAACGCIETSTEAAKWRTCSLAVAKAHGEERFYNNYIEARAYKLKLLPTTPARFSKLNEKFVKKCGNYADARRRDLKAGWSKYQVPENSVELMWH